MARRGIELFDLIELYTHWHAGRLQVQLWQSLEMDRKTIRKHLAPAVTEGIHPGGEPLTAGAVGGANRELVSWTG